MNEEGLLERAIIDILLLFILVLSNLEPLPGEVSMLLVWILKRLVSMICQVFYVAVRN